MAEILYVLLIHIMVYGKHISCENPNKYKSMKTYTQQLLSNVSRTIKYRILIIKMGVFFFFLHIRTYFPLPGWTGSYFWGYLNAKFQPTGSQITRFLHAGFYCIFYGRSSFWWPVTSPNMVDVLEIRKKKNRENR